MYGRRSTTPRFKAGSEIFFQREKIHFCDACFFRDTHLTVPVTSLYSETHLQRFLGFSKIKKISKVFSKFEKNLVGCCRATIPPESRRMTARLSVATSPSPSLQRSPRPSANSLRWYRISSFNPLLLSAHPSQNPSTSTFTPSLANGTRCGYGYPKKLL